MSKISLTTAASRIRGLVRYSRNLRGFLDETVTVEQAERSIRGGIERREQRFLAKLDSAVYSYERSPYRQLLRAAGCEPDDIRRLVSADGLDGALRKLKRAGVYVTYDEFKFGARAVRGSQTFHFDPSDFDDPRLEPETIGSTGGTRGKPTPTGSSVAFLEQMTPHWAVFFAENDCLDKPLTFWTPGHAGVTGRHLCCAKIGKRYLHWFVAEEMTAAKDRIYATCKRWLADREGHFPAPEAAPYSKPEIVLERLLPLLAQGVAMNTAPSAAVKLSLAAQQRGVDLRGLTFLLGAEPLTAARKRAIEECGARATPLYGSTEATWIGGQCRQPQSPDEVHVLLDNYAVIAGDCPEEGSESSGRPILLTSLQRITPKVLLNTDIGDRGMLAERNCDCLYGRLGCHTVLHSIRSSDKITEFGANIAVADVTNVLEDALPRRFGGVAGDYQLVESRNSSGLPRYTLCVDPRVELASETSVAATFVSELNRLRSYYGYMTAIWEKEKALAVRRIPARATRRGKIPAFLRVAPDEELEASTRNR